MSYPMLALAVFLFFGPIELRRQFDKESLPPAKRRRVIFVTTMIQWVGILIFLIACVTG